MKYDNYLSLVQDFGQQDWVNNQLMMSRKPNFWTILEYGEKSTVKSYEIRLSRMFRWLFDPNANHGLGNIFAHLLFQYHNKENKERQAVTYEYDANPNPDIQVTSEEKHIDLLYKHFTKGIIIAIELKHHADEGIRQGTSQLEDYEKAVKKMIDGKAIEPYCFYLTPTGKPSTRSNIDPKIAEEDPDALKFRWIPISYSSFIDFIVYVEKEILEKMDAPFIQDTQKLVSDFKEDLQRSVDIITVTKNKAFLNENITREQITLTQNLAKNIKQGTQSRDLQNLIELNKDPNLKLKEIILIMNDVLSAQNHTPHVGVQILIRKIYNYFSNDKQLPCKKGEIKEYAANEQFDAIKEDIIKKGLPLKKVMITREKGQGLYLYHESLPYRIYMSGDAHGNFPNDGVQLLPLKKTDGSARKIPGLYEKTMFILDEKDMLDNKIKMNDGHLINFDDFVENYLLPGLKNAISQIKEVIK